jgi:hypothetical protein
LEAYLGYASTILIFLASKRFGASMSFLVQHLGRSRVTQASLLIVGSGALLTREPRPCSMHVIRTADLLLQSHERPSTILLSIFKQTLPARRCAEWLQSGFEVLPPFMHVHDLTRTGPRLTRRGVFVTRAEPATPVSG